MALSLGTSLWIRLSCAQTALTARPLTLALVSTNQIEPRRNGVLCWPKPLPWPLTLGHELAGVIDEKGPALEADFMGRALAVGDKVMLPPLMPCRECYYCVHYPTRANRCLNPTYYGRYIPFEQPPHLWGG